MATSYNAPGSILVINLTEDGPNVIPKVIRLPEYVSGLISLHGIDFQKWLRLVEVHNSIGIMRQMSQTELRLCFVKDMTRSIGEASNWKHIDMTLPVMKFPAVHADFFFDVLRGTSELLMESHIQTADGPGHVTLHTISFEEILQDYNYDLARKWNWKPLRIRGQIEEIPNEFYYGCMLSKMVIPFDENLRQLTIRKYNNSGEGESHLPTGVASSICPSEHLVCAMPSTVNMQASETLGPPHTLENERVDGGENPLVNLSPIISEGFRTVSENEKVESGDDGRTKAVNVTAPGGGCVSDCLAPVDGGEDPSVYISPIISEGSGTLSENEQVEFEIESVDDGRTMAVNVTAPGGGSQSSGEYVGSRSGGGYGGGGDL